MSAAVVKVLRKARALVAKGWTQGTYARSKSGRPVKHLGRAAARFCAIGALDVAAHSSGDRFTYSDARDALRQAVGVHLLPEWNDESGRTKADVLAAFDRAIRAEAGK